MGDSQNTGYVFADGKHSRYAATELMKSLLFGVSAQDPMTFASVAALRVLVASGILHSGAPRDASGSGMALHYE